MQWSKLYSLWRENHLDHRLKGQVIISQSVMRSSDNQHSFYVVFNKETVLVERKREWPSSCLHDLKKMVVSLPFEDAIASSNSFIRGLSYLDKRFGRTKTVNAMFTETDPFARKCLKLKLDLLKLLH
jgi:hypothetical protein